MAQLRQQKGDFDRRNIQVLLISFGAIYWAKAWQQETQAPFPMLLDPSRDLYRAYGLESSVRRTWSPRTIWFYVRQTLRGRTLFKNRGALHQLGGDFIVDSEGIIRFAYYSYDPVDRPGVADLQRVFDGLQDR